jgi:hypothetical protein
LKNNDNGTDKLLVDNGGNATSTYAAIPLPSSPSVPEYSFDQIEVTRKGALRILGSSSSLTFENQTMAGDGTGRLEAEGIVHGPQDLTLTNLTLAILGDVVDTQTITLSGKGALELCKLVF